MARFDDDFETLDEHPGARGSQLSGEAPDARPAPVALDHIPTELSQLSSQAGRYEIRSRLGTGGMGEVRFCRDHRIGRDVALKVLLPKHRGDPSVRLRFLREARIQGQLEHPSIVPVYDLGVDGEGAAYFTMKYLRGMTLAKVLNGLRANEPTLLHSFSRRKLLTAFSAICLAVDFAHSRGVLHRDLKPANIILGEFGEVYLLDWGVAKILDASERSLEISEVPMSARTIPGELLGTVGYMSPEQAEGSIDALDARSDVYALGSILFEILTLKPLHPKAGRADMLNRILHGADARASARAPDRDVPPELEAICVKATRQNPDERYRSARALHDAVERFLDGDRDIELRRDLALKHATLAESATEKALSGGEGAEEARRRALHEVGRALAFDPSNEQAARALRRILMDPPRELPAEVEHEIEAAAAARHRLQLYAAVKAELAAAVIATLWSALLLRVLEWVVFGAMLLFTAASSTMKLLAARSAERPSGPWFAYLGYAFNVLAFLCISRGFGPLLFMPMLLTMLTYGNTATYKKAYRIAVVSTGCIAILIAVLVESLGLLPRSYVFKDNALIILPRAVVHSQLWTTLALTGTTLFMLVVPAFMMDRQQRTLRDAEQRAFLQAWQMRQLLPERPRRRGVTTPAPSSKPDPGGPATGDRARPRGPASTPRQRR